MASPKPGVIPHLLSPNCLKHIEWLKNVFGGEVKEIYYKDAKKEKVMHCEVAVNGGFVYIADRSCHCASSASEDATEPRGFLCHLDVEDPNEIWKKAASNGATTVTDLKVQFWGDLYGSFKDPFGFQWSVSKEKEPKPGVTPYLLSPAGDCEKHIEWLKKVFGAEVKEIYHNDDKKVMHCSLAVNGAFVYLADGPICNPEHSVANFICHLDVPDPKSVWESALSNEATSVVELKVQFWGDLCGVFKDTFGFEWSLGEAKQPTKSSSKTGVIPYLVSPDCEKHIEWLKNVFAAEVKEIYHADDNKVMHCSLAINDGFLYLADAACTVDLKGKLPEGEPHGMFCHLEVPDPNVIWKKAMGNGATTIVELKKQFWGGVFGTFKDPFGYEWGVMKSGQ